MLAGQSGQLPVCVTPEAETLGGFATFLATLLLREQASRCFPCIGVRGMPRTREFRRMEGLI